MKKYIFFIFSLVAVSGIHCLKGKSGCNNVSPSSEAAQMQSYANSQGINPSITPSGLYYQVINPGSGVTPNLNSVISVNYTGKLLDGTVFDSHTGVPLVAALGGLIQGWQIGLQLIQKGGEIKLIIPSSLAYGCQGAGSIPANSIVYFDVVLVDVQ